MSRRRKRNRGPSQGQSSGSQSSGGQSGSGKPGGGQGGGGQGGAGQGGGGGRGNNKRRRSSNRQREGAGFWGDHQKLPAAQQDIRITDDPDAVPRSLGLPPLTGHEKVAAHYFTAIYDRAVTTAGALAAAGGLIEPDVLAEELGDD